MSNNAVSGAELQQLVNVAVEQFFKVLEVEVHERTLCHAIQMMSRWISKYYNEVPKKVIDGLKV